jgi:acetyltransferase EpsM
MEKKEILLFGAGGHASKLVGILEEQGNFTIAGYISTEEKGTVIHNYAVLGNVEDYNSSSALREKFYHIAIGENSVRYEIYEAVNRNHERLAAIISSHAVIAPDALAGSGTAVLHNVVIWNRVKTGICCIIDTGAIVEHDSEIGDFVNISPGATICGGVTIGRGAIIGAGATVIEKVTIGENCLVGAGSVVINDIEPNTVAVGNPARVIRERRFTDTYLK